MNISEKYKNFLEIEARKASFEKRRLDDGKSLLISWWDKADRAIVEKGSSDIMDLIYFGVDPSKTVVMDQGVAKMLRERLNNLEEENLRLHRQIRRIKTLVYGLTVATLIAALSVLL